MLHAALADLRTTWVDLATTDLLYKLVALVLLAPLSTVVLSLSLWFSGSTVLADQDILFFALSPLGLAGLVTIAAVSLAVVALEQACLISIGVTAAEGAPASQMSAVRHAVSKGPAVVGLMAHLTGRVLLMTTPFLLVIGGVYQALLSTYDINYYLTERPVELWIAVVIATMLLVGLAVVLVPRLIGWGLSLPLVILENRSPGEALQLSRERSDGYRQTIALVLVGWAAASVLLSSTALGAVALLGRGVAPLGQGSLGLALALMLGVLVLWFVVSYLVTLAQSASFALLVSELYEAVGRSADARPVSEVLGSRATRQWRIPASLSLKILLAALTAAAFAEIGLGVTLLQAFDLERGIVVIAHRGASRAAPENTRAAVKRAIADGADFVEIDVQETTDGEVVVLPDSDFMKTSRVDLKVWDASWSHLQTLDIGSWFAPRFGDQRVPRLAEVLEMCRGKATVMIELKYYGHDVRLEERVIETVEAAAMGDDVVMMSLNASAVDELRRLRPTWTVGLLAATAVGDLTRVDTDFLAVSTALASRDFVRRAHSREKHVYVWTVNDPVQMVRMASLGIDGLITDVPATARRVLDEAAEMNTMERLVIALSFFFGAAAPDPPVEDDLESWSEPLG